MFHSLEVQVKFIPELAYEHDIDPEKSGSHIPNLFP
jgi:hypothetical protein